MIHKINQKNVSRETLDYVSALLDGYENKLSLYAELLLWWNGKVNLLSRNTTKQEIEKHIIHSLFLSISALFPKQEFLVDIGTGGGLPGIPLAICFPDKEFVLLDRVSKKTTAVHDMCRQLGLQNVNVSTKELKTFHVEHPVAWISKHAIKISELIQATGGQKWEIAFLLKGMDFMDELEELDEPLKVISYAIDSAMSDPFYSGKRVLQLKK